jgi:hypothetical protein
VGEGCRTERIPLVRVSCCVWGTLVKVVVGGDAMGAAERERLGLVSLD